MKTLLFLSILFVSSSLFAESVTLTWKTDNSKDIKGYIIRKESKTGVSTFMDVGNTTRFNVEGLIINHTYKFSVTAYDSKKQEGEPSEWLVYTPRKKEIKSILPKPILTIERND